MGWGSVKNGGKKRGAGCSKKNSEILEEEQKGLSLSF